MGRSRLGCVWVIAAVACLWAQPCSGTIVQPYPSNKQPLRSLLRQGWLAYQRGDLRIAIILYRQASVLNPRDPSLHYDLGCLYALSGELPRARQALHQALALNPEFATAYDVEIRFLKHLDKIHGRLDGEGSR